MTEGESLSSWLRLTLVSGIGGERQRKLLRAFGLPEAVFSSGRSALRSVIGDKAADLLLDTRNEALVACAIAWSEGPDQYIITLADPEYRDFQCKLTPTISKAGVIGVRTPALRGLAKELSGTDAAAAFLRAAAEALTSRGGIPKRAAP